MDQYHEQISQYIQSRIHAGVTLETVRQELLNVGWPADVVDMAIKSTPSATLPAPSTLVPGLSSQYTQNSPSSGVRPQTDHVVPSKDHKLEEQQTYQPYQPYAQPQAENSQPNQNQLNQPAAFQPVNPAQQVGQQPGYPAASDANTSIQPAAADENVPQKYKVFRSVADGVRAMKNNFPAYLSAAVSSLLIGGTALTFSGMFLFGFLSFTPDTGSSNILGDIIGKLFIFFVVSTILYAVIYSFITAAISYPLMSGIEHKQDNIFGILWHALKQTPKIMLANALLYIIMLLPILLCSILVIFIVFRAAGIGSGSAGLALLPILTYLADMTWIIIAALRYGLTPYVIMFEDDISLLAAFKRSHHLLKKGGQWFLFKGFVLYFVIVIIAVAVTGQKAQSLQSGNSIGFDIFALILLLFANNSLVMLYRNRRIVRGNQ